MAAQPRTDGNSQTPRGALLSETQQLEGLAVAETGAAASRPAFFSGLRGRLLILTAIFVFIAVALIYPSLAGIYRTGWLDQRAQAAQIAVLAVQAAPDGRVSDELSRQLLTTAQVVSVAVQQEEQRELILAPSLEIPPDLVTIDMRKEGGLRPILDAFDHIFAPDGRFLRIILTPSMTNDLEMEVIVPEAALKAGLLTFSRNLLILSVIISAVVGAAVYFAIYRLVVRPMRGLTNSIVKFAEQPEAAEIAPMPGESDEMQRANAALQGMQKTVSAAFRQRKRLAELGEAVAKINHDLRNSLAAAQIVSEGLAQSEDPRVKRAVPRLERAIERAISLAEGTLRYGRAEPPQPQVQKLNIVPTVTEAAQEGLASWPEIEWRIDAPGEMPALADADHLHRIVANLVRNAARAISDQSGRTAPGQITARVFQSNGSAVVEIADNGPGIPPNVASRLFQPFSGSGSRDGAGLGLAIARELARGMKGELELSSSGAEGAVFTLRVPAAA